MTNKRKSMNTGDDVHAIAPKVRSHCEAMFKGFQGCCPDKSGPPWALLANSGSLCSQYVPKAIKVLKNEALESYFHFHLSGNYGILHCLKNIEIVDYNIQLAIQ